MALVTRRSSSLPQTRRQSQFRILGTTRRCHLAPMLRVQQALAVGALPRPHLPALPLQTLPVLPRMVSTLRTENKSCHRQVLVRSRQHQIPLARCRHHWCRAWSRPVTAGVLLLRLVLLHPLVTVGKWLPQYPKNRSSCIRTDRSQVQKVVQELGSRKARNRLCSSRSGLNHPCSRGCL